jgi:hypothetical protein
MAIPASLQGCYLPHQQLISHMAYSLLDEGTDPSARAFESMPSKKYVNRCLLLCCLTTNYQAYGVNLLGRSIRFELKHHNVYDAHFVIF